MGCDIHVYVEKLNPETKEWEFQRPPEIQLYYYPNTMTEPAVGEYWYWGRNYRLFAMLADVRNYASSTGWGSPERRKVEPLSAPRGVPEDASPTYRKLVGNESCCALYNDAGDWSHVPGCDEVTGWGVDGHSHSWFTLRELMLVDWDKKSLYESGWVSATEFERWRTQGAPTSWSGSIGGGSIKHVSNDEMATLIKTGAAHVNDLNERVRWDQRDKYFTEVSWTESWRSAAGGDWFEFLDRIKPLTLDDGSDVRVVFFFDN